MYKLSVIIPVYNAENTLSRAVDSVLNQNWRGNINEDIEIILVDDCSTDNSMDILNQYSRKYDNIKVFFTEKNSGFPSTGRNIGIKSSTSEYVMFMDNDDEYCKDMCQTVFDVITKEQVDVVTCNWYNVVGDKVSKNNLKVNNDVIKEGNIVIIDSITPIFINEWWPWKYVYKRSFLIDNNILFPIDVCEDVFFLCNVLLNMDKMVYIKDLYGYKRHFRKDSLSAMPKVDIILKYINAFIEVEDLLQVCFDFDEHETYRFKFARVQITSNIIKIINLQKTADMKICLDKLYEYESKIQFDNSIEVNSIPDRLIKTINFFVLRKNWKLSIILMKLCSIPLKLRKILG